MSVDILATTERSNPFIDDLIQSRAETGWEAVTTAELVGRLIVPTLVRDPRESATQLVVIAGGAASGKSTLAKNMSRELAEQNTASAVISSDDFVLWDRQERHRRERADMPPEEKYDFHEMRRAIGAICANQDPHRTIAVSQYDSNTGLAIDRGRRRHIPRVDVLIVEGDMLGEQGRAPQDLYPAHALEPVALYAHVSDQERLSRRVARDMKQRNGNGATPEDIVESFTHRQDTQHLPYTLTYASSADFILTPVDEETGCSVRAYDMYAMQKIVANANLAAV